MTNLVNFLEWFAAKLPRKVIGEDCPDKGPLMIRYYLIRTRWFGVYLHKFLRSDERTMHDHPWWFWSLILVGEYIEHMSYALMGGYRRVGSIAYRPAKWVHRVELLADIMPEGSAGPFCQYKPVWSLVLAGRKVREWGFWERDGWKRAEDHVTDCD